jgi:hypothetical protein
MPNLDALVREMTIRAVLWDIASFIGWALALYWIVKAAIRDGIRDSGLLDAQRRTLATRQRDNLPDMRAD